MPYHIHVYAKPSPDFTYKNVLEYLYKYNFTGKVFVFFIQTTLIKQDNLNHKYYFTVECSTMSAIQICNRFFNNSVLHTYGYKNGSGYHPDINRLINNTYFTKNYKIDKEYKKYYDFIKNFYINNINKYKLSTKQLYYKTKLIQIDDFNINLN